MGNNPFHLAKEIFDRLSPMLDDDILYSSRVHPLLSFGEGVYVKREDESGFACSGTKRRKFASLLPHLQKHKIEEALLIGGANSNHIMALSQLLREKKVDFRLFLKKANQDYTQGNGFLLRLLANENQIQWIENEQWPKAIALASIYGEKKGTRYMIIPEGGNCKEAVAGAATLMLDIIKNERERLFPVNKKGNLPGSFDHIWVDSGTGLTAAVLAAMNAVLSGNTQIHVVLMAGDEAYFHQTYKKATIWLNELLNISTPSRITYLLHFPVTARSFGSINAQVRQAVVSFAREEGILTDPIYTAKLFLTAKEKIKSEQYKGTHLLIHSGGGTGLMGFAEQIGKAM